MSHPRIELFGGYRLIVDGRVISLSNSQKAAVLLAYLACRSGRETPREVLIETLWPDSDAESGRTRLRTVLSDLRKLLADNAIPETEVLAASRGGVALDFALVSTDLGEFHELIKTGHGMRTERTRMLEAALDLYKGDLLTGFYDEWAQALRDEVAKCRARVINELASLYESEGRPDRAASTLMPLVKDDPLNEEAHCEIMRLHLAAGSISSVLKQYADLTRMLKEELDVEPGDRAQSLALAARSQSAPRRHAVVRPTVENPETEESAAGFQDSATPNTARRRWASAALIALGILSLSVAGSQFGRQKSRPKSPLPAAPSSMTFKKPAWLYQFDPKEGDKGSDSRAIAVDRSGNVYIAGFVDTNDNDVDFLVVKLDRHGNEAWPEPFRYNGPGDDVDRIYDVEVDELGNVYVTGDSDNGTNESEWTNLDSLDFCTIKIGPDGKPSQTWSDVGDGVGVRRYNGPDNGEDMPKQILVDNGSVFVLGYTFSRKGGRDMAVVRYDQNGHQKWAATFDGLTHDEDMPSNMCLDGEGGLYVTGFSRGGPRDSPETDLVVIKYRASDGNREWLTPWGANNQFDDSGVAVSSEHENVYVYGIGRTRTGTFNHQRPGVVVIGLDGRSGRVRALRGATTAADHLDRFYTASNSRIVGEYEGETRVVYRDLTRSEFYSKHSNLTDVSVFHGTIGTYIVGTVPVAPSPDQPAIPKIRTVGLGSEWVFPGPGGPPHTCRAATIWEEPVSRTHDRQWVVITGQYGTAEAPHVMALSYDAHVIAVPPERRGPR